jgi:ubiquinone/menaquinone biosynthesis C-methylase UbiE
MNTKVIEDSKIFTEVHYTLMEHAALYVSHLIFDVLNETGITAKIETDFVTVDDIVDKFNLDPCISPVPLTWMLGYLSQQGCIVKKYDNNSNVGYKLEQKFPKSNSEGIEKKLLSLSKDFQPSCELLRKVAQKYPDFLRGYDSGFNILFVHDKMQCWRQYFTNYNAGYCFYNTFGAYGVSRWFPPKKEIIVLEVGCGTGSGTIALMNHLKECNLTRHIKNYIISDISLTFLKTIREDIDKHVTAAPPFVLKRVDINRPFVKQEIADNSIDIIYGVNVLHVAKNLSFSLKEIYSALKEKGKLIISECVRSTQEGLFFKEFIFNMLDNFISVEIDPITRPTRGFLAPQYWKLSLKKSGFTNIDMLTNTDANAASRFSDKVFAMIIKGQKG